MPKEGFTVVTITQQAHDRARTRYNQKVRLGQVAPKKSFSRYVNDLIVEKVEEDENLARQAPFMQKVGMQDNSIMIKDNKIGRIAEVQIRGKDLICMLDERKDCVHVGFAYAVPDVYRVISEKKK